MILKFFSNNDEKNNLAVLVLINVFLAFLTHFLIIFGLGVSDSADALIASQAVPGVIVTIFGAVLSKQLIPFFKEFSTEKGALFSILAIVVVLIFVIFSTLLVSEDIWLKLIFYGLTDAAMKDLLALSTIALFSLFPSVCVCVLTAYWQSNNSFVRVEFAVFFASLLGLVLLIPAISLYGAIGAAFVLALRAFLLFFMMLVGCPDRGFYKINRKFKMALTRELVPAFGFSTVLKITPLLDRAIVAYAGSGAVSLLNFLQQIYGVLLIVSDRIFSPRIISKASDVSEHSRRSDLFWENESSQLKWLGLLALFCLSVGALMPVVLSSFLSNSLGINLYIVSLIMSVSLISGFLAQQSESFLYGIRNAKKVFIFSSIGLFLGLVLKVVGCWQIGFYGVVLGIAFNSFVNAFLMRRFTYAYFYK